MSLRQLWLDYNESHRLHRLLDHADHYEQHLPPRRGNGTLKLLEIGVQSGGSARAWKQWYRDRLYYVGVDIEPNCTRTARHAENIFVEIGSQTNASFLQHVCRKHGPFDVIIDDGAHRAPMMIMSLRALWPYSECMNEPSLYVIEDMQTMVIPFYTANPREMYDIVGEAFWAMHHHWAGWHKRANRSDAGYGGLGVRVHPVWRDLVAGVHAYDSIAFFERQRKARPIEFSRGKSGLKYGKGHPINQKKKADSWRGKPEIKLSDGSIASPGGDIPPIDGED